jgi:hypothetical protein
MESRPLSFFLKREIISLHEHAEAKKENKQMSY